MEFCICDVELDPELYFISGQIFDLNLPKEQQYLYRYFTTARQRQFVRYYTTYRQYTRFADHTGYASSERWLKRMRRRLLELENAYRQAKSSGDFSALAQLESGQYSVAQ